MRISTMAIVAISSFTGCGGVASNTAAKSADGLNWPACIEWMESLETDGKSVKEGQLICSADENELNALVPRLKSALADRHPKVEFHTVPVQK